MPNNLFTIENMFFSRLGCWCKPQLCHGDVLVELVNKLCLDDDDKSAEPIFDLLDDFPWNSEPTECTSQPQLVFPKRQDSAELPPKAHI